MSAGGGWRDRDHTRGSLVGSLAVLALPMLASSLGGGVVFQLVDLGSQLKPVIEEFYATESLRTCKHCGEVMQPPAP